MKVSDTVEISRESLRKLLDMGYALDEEFHLSAEELAFLEAIKKLLS